MLNTFIKALPFAPTHLAEGQQFATLPTDLAPTLSEGLLTHYFLDRSSIFAPLLLPLAPHARVLDMCAAPGGKLLVMLSRQVADVQFLANDLSPARAERLRRVIKEYVPEDFAKRYLRITNRDAVSFALKEPASFDAVLLDAPCSSEAHVARNIQLLKKFTGLRKWLPQRQYSLLSAALLAAKPGGYVMYATCTINKLENDEVIKKAVARKKIPCEIVPLTPPLGQTSEYGVTILPHLHGAGPAFYSLLKRL